MYKTKQEKALEKAANDLLKKNGYGWDGRAIKTTKKSWNNYLNNVSKAPPKYITYDKGSK